MNESKNIFDHTISYLKYQYWLSIVVLALYFILIFFDLIPYPFKGKEVSIILERYVIVITIIAIPVALKLFAEMLKKTPPSSSTNFVVGKYKKATDIRLAILNTVTLMNILLYAVSKNMNFFWFTIILFIIYIFCKPSYPELISLIKTEKARKENNNEILPGEKEQEQEQEQEQRPVQENGDNPEKL